jgi:tetratricopeptide (TPR) repeat protein
MHNKLKKDEIIRTYQQAFHAFGADDFNEALRLIDRVLEARPSSSNSWALKGRALYELGNLSEGDLASKKSIELNSACHPSWITLGLIHSDRQQFEHAASCFKHAAEIDPDKSILTLLAAVEYEFDPASARRHAREALDIDPQWDEAKRILDEATKITSKK